MPRVETQVVDVKWWSEFRARREELQAAHNDRIRVRPLRGRQRRDIVCVVPEVPRESSARTETTSFTRTVGPRRVINTVFAGACK